MRAILIPICGLAALTAACGDGGVRISSTRTQDDAKGVLKVVDALQCPQTIGVLTRKGTAQADGATCLYGGPRGAMVELRLIALNDTAPATVLGRLETELSAELPRAAEAVTGDAPTGFRVDAVEGSTEAGTSNRASVRGPGVAIDADGDNASVRLPGMNIEAKGDRASIRILGININADKDRADIGVRSGEGNVSIRAHDSGAQIRTTASGEATRNSWLLTDSRASDAGWRLVGYEARGPAGGPLVVATIRSKTQDRDSTFQSARELVVLNVGD